MGNTILTPNSYIITKYDENFKKSWTKIFKGKKNPLQNWLL